MKQSAGFGAIALVSIMLIAEILSAGAYVVSTAKADPKDPCYGYAICR